MLKLLPEAKKKVDKKINISILKELFCFKNTEKYSITV